MVPYAIVSKFKTLQVQYILISFYPMRPSGVVKLVYLHHTNIVCGKYSILLSIKHLRTRSSSSCSTTILIIKIWTIIGNAQYALLVIFKTCFRHFQRAYKSQESYKYLSSLAWIFVWPRWKSRRFFLCSWHWILQLVMAGYEILDLWWLPIDSDW